MVGFGFAHQGTGRERTFQAGGIMWVKTQVRKTCILLTTCKIHLLWMKETIEMFAHVR